jgi:plastocyanin
MAMQSTALTPAIPRITRRTLLRGTMFGLGVATARVFPAAARISAGTSMPVAAQPAPGIELPSPVIVLTDDRQVPPEICVPLGSTVTWENDGSGWVAIAALNGAFESGQVEPGCAFAHTFDHPGSVTYICRNHPIRNMTGRISIR